MRTSKNDPKNLKKFIKEQLEYTDDMNEEYKYDVLRYSGDTYEVINEYLTTGFVDARYKESEIRKLIYNIDSAINQAPPLKNDLFVYRGINLPSVKNQRYNKETLLFGFSGRHQNYISTSLDKEVALSMIEENIAMGRPTNRAVFRIKIPKGTKVLYVAPIGHIAEEEEVLLPRNTTLEITGLKNNIIDAIVVL